MSDNEDKDLTRIEDLAEFLHDESDDGLFDEEASSKDEMSALPSLDDLDDSDTLEEESPPEFEAPAEAEPESMDFGETSFDSPDEEQEMAEFGGDTDFGGESEFGSSEEPEFGADEFSMSEEVSSIEDEAPEVSFDAIEESQVEDTIVDEPSFDEPEEVQDESPEFEPAQVETYDPTPAIPTPSQPQQNFEDLRQFGESISYGAVAQGGNPPFSLVLRGIRYQEDASDIMIILREHGLVTDDNEQSLEQGLANGSLLISQISEYSAIYLAHRFRRFDLEVMVGLSDEIHPSQSYDADARGLVSKQNIRQNINESFDLDRAPVRIQNIMLTTTPTLEGYTIREYLGVISHHAVLSAAEIEEFSPVSDQTGDEVVDAIQRDLREVLEKHGSDIEDIRPFGQGLEALYHDMADALRAHALKIGANAVVGINYQLTPVIKHEGRSTDVQYKVTCLGSAVWAVGD